MFDRDLMNEYKCTFLKLESFDIHILPIQNKEEKNLYLIQL